MSLLCRYSLLLAKVLSSNSAISKLCYYDIFSIVTSLLYVKTPTPSLLQHCAGELLMPFLCTLRFFSALSKADPELP